MKILTKLAEQKIKKTLHAFLETIISQIISQNFFKIILNPKELERLEYVLVINFFKNKTLLVRIFLTFRFIHVNNTKDVKELDNTH